MELIKRIENEFPIKGIYLLKIDIYKQHKLTITIAKEDGRITVGDCEIVSKRLKTFIPEEFDLVVQSPGIGWEINKDSEVRFFIGEKVNICYKEKEKIINKVLNLKSEEGENLIFEDKRKKQIIYINKDNIIKMKVEL
ncbi:MAG: hypothetical protein N3A58_09090 [Spirochaetes bacterium]|nr:hypothetical protein [Spirochaetota bacterium]